MAREQPPLEDPPGGPKPLTTAASRTFSALALRVLPKIPGVGRVLELKVALGSLAVLAVLAALALGLLVAVSVAVGGGRGDQPAGGAAGTCQFAPGTADPPPAELVPIYQDAAAQYQLGDQGWAVLAGVNRAETSFGKNMAVSSAGAFGWMQFMSGTWERYGVDADHDGKVDPYDPDDAIHAAAKYFQVLLKNNGGNWTDALYSYNGDPHHSGHYPQDVLAHAAAYQGGCVTVAPSSPTGTTPGTQGKLLPDGTVLAPESAPEKVKEMIAAANRIANKPYEWGGGHPQSDTIQNGYDCSGYTMYILHATGLFGSGNATALNFMSYGEPGQGRWVNIWASGTHVWMEIAGVQFNSGGTGRTGSAWRSTVGVPGPEFVARHPPGL